ncbi:hypothetical protein HPB51_014171 [Rhipicephalus microplus]|uniref:Uncharacterized protein n=1 Tax=Rhipicephalus microplus TaxID=6941 RepID=A0A9J6E2G6_RHIMP|nr:hypothetical protein HPB51_014171 [Rhipicephalus microplus]
MPLFRPVLRCPAFVARATQEPRFRHVDDSSKIMIMVALIISCLILTVVAIFTLRGAGDNDDDIIEVDQEKNDKTTKMPLPKAVVIPGIEKDAPGHKTSEPGMVTPVPTPEFTTRTVKEILCTVGHSAVMSSMYPPEGLCQYLYYTDVVIVRDQIRASLVQDSWKLFQVKARTYQYVKGGIGFDYRTFNADAVIAISSVSTMESSDDCYAVPPNVLRSPAPQFPSLETHWPLVRDNTTHARSRTLLGLSFEMGTMFYVLKREVVRPLAGAYANCTGFGMTSRDAVCGPRRNTEFLDEPYVVYSAFLRSDTWKYVAFAEYFTSTRDKYHKALQKYGSVRSRLAWMLFNVHLVDVLRTCGSGTFTVIRLICQEIRGQFQCG